MTVWPLGVLLLLLIALFFRVFVGDLHNERRRGGHMVNKNLSEDRLRRTAQAFVDLEAWIRKHRKYTLGTGSCVMPGDYEYVILEGRGDDGKRHRISVDYEDLLDWEKEFHPSLGEVVAEALRLWSEEDKVGQTLDFPTDRDTVEEQEAKLGPIPGRHTEPGDMPIVPDNEDKVIDENATNIKIVDPLGKTVFQTGEIDVSVMNPKESEFPHNPNG